MKKFISIVFLLLCSLSYSQTIDQQLVVVKNDGSVGGQLVVALQVKGTNLTAANTLGSATIDIKYDNSKLTYVNASNWAFNLFQQAANIKSFVRVGVTGGIVSPGNSKGFDIADSYSTWVLLNFTINDPAGVKSLSIAPGSNAIGLFEHHANDPQTNVISDVSLTTPNVLIQPLPVELTSFTAAPFGNKVDLKWKTAIEVNNNGFEIERKSNNSEWKKVGYIKGNGNSNKSTEYSFIDLPVGDVNFQYRLKQIDFNGKFTFSDLVSVKLEIPAKYSLEQNFPNPFNPTTNIRFELPEAAHVTIKIYNMLGQEVFTLLNKNVDAGYQNVVFDASKIASGTYIYRMDAGKYSQIKKMTLLK